ncbi:MAG: hypothetical protein WEH44_06080 [Pirellulaceae bacterium]
MTGFIVTCETCQTRLRVHDDGAAGQIHPCPKCGGMVAVVPPAVATEPEAAGSEPASSAVVAPVVGLLLQKPVLALVMGGSILFAAVGIVTLFVTQSADDSPIVVDVAATPADIEPDPIAPSETAGAPENAIQAEPPSAEPADSVAEVASAEPKEPTAAPVQPVASDPLDVDPAELELATEGDEVQAVESVAAADDEQESVPPEPKPNVLVELGPTDTNQPANRSAAQQLALKLENVELPAVPLADVLEMISDLAAIPITIEPATLRMAGITARSPVTLAGADITLAELLSNILAKHRLSYDDRDGQIVIRHMLAEQTQAVDYKVADLVPAGSNAADLASLIERMVDPSSWQAAGGPGRIAAEGATLKMHNSRRVLFDVLVFCERLRLSRGLPKQSRISSEILLIESPYAALQPALEKETTFTFPAWTPLKQVFRYIGKETGATVLVDWPALAELNLDPQSQLMCSAIDARWDAAIDGILESLELTCIAVDPQTIWVTSRTAAAELKSVQFYSVDAEVLAENSSPESLVAALQDDFPAAQFEYDAPSKHLIVLAPEPIHRQLWRRLSSHQSPITSHPRLSQSAVPAP